MENAFSNISLKTKFLILTGVFTVSFLLALIIVFASQSVLDKSAKKIDQLDNFKVELSNLRVSVNALRGEVLVMLLTDRKYGKGITESLSGYNEHRASIDRLKISLHETQEVIRDQKLASSLGQVFKDVGALSGITDPYIQVATAGGGEGDSLQRQVLDKIMNEYVPSFIEFRKDIASSYSIVDALQNASKYDYQEAVATRNTLLVSFFVGTTITVLVFSQYLGRMISRPILKAKNVLEEISRGTVPTIHYAHSKDEIGSMLRSLKTLVHNLDTLRSFTAEVGNGNFDTQVTLFENKGAIAEALLIMRDKLKESAAKERHSKWKAQGLAEAGTLLRMKYEDTATLYNAAVRFVVTFLSANQGSLFVMTGEDSGVETLDLLACYAYDRKKYLQKTIYSGEGLVGQVYLEKTMLYLTDVPQNYVKITSGLGEANPTCLVILPLIHNEVVQGVLEIASFNKMEEHQMSFLKQFGDLIASDIAREKFATQTRHLLERSQQQAEELRATEEELRQNMEELTATQEELQRRLKEVDYSHAMA